MLDHDPGAKVAFGSERQIAARPRERPAPNRPGTASRARPRAARPARADRRLPPGAEAARHLRARPDRRVTCLERGMVEPSAKRGGQSSWCCLARCVRRAPLLADGRLVADLRGFAGRGHLALRKLLGAQPGRLAVVRTRFVISGAAGRHDDCPAAVLDEFALRRGVVISCSAVSWSPASGAAMKRSTHTTAASSWRACAAESSAISRALPPVTQPPQEKPTMVATMTDPAQAQNSTALLARYCWKRCDRVWF